MLRAIAVILILTVFQAGAKEVLTLNSISDSPDPFVPSLSGTATISGTFSFSGTRPNVITPKVEKRTLLRMKVEVISGNRTVRTLTADADASAGAPSPVTLNVQFDGKNSEGESLANQVLSYKVSGALVKVTVRNGKTRERARFNRRLQQTGTLALTSGIVDTTAPQLSVPANVVAEATGPEGAVVLYPPATAIDDFAAPDSIAITYSIPSGSQFPLGGTPVTVTATDLAGNMSTGTFTVNVADTIAPVFSNLSDVIVNSTSPGGAIVTFDAVAFDAVTPSPTVTFNPPSGSFFPSGITQVLATAIDDAGNIRTNSFEVRVINAGDTTPPLITVISPTNGSVASSARPLISASFSDPGGIDVSSLRVDFPNSLEVEASASGFTARPLQNLLPGTYNVSVSVSDLAGNTASTNWSFTVSDTGQ